MFRIDQEAIQLPGMLRIIMSDTEEQDKDPS